MLSRFRMKYQMPILLSIILILIISIKEVDATDSKIEITKKDCNRLIRYRQKSKVNYKPDTNIRGRKILPANISDNNMIKLPDIFEFNVAIDIRKYLGGPEDDSAVASAAVIAADKATIAATSAKTAATSAEAIATIAETISTAATANAVTAAAAVATAKTALDNDPLNKTLRSTWETAKAALEAANTSATIAASDASTIKAAAAKTRAAANSADSAILTANKASYAETSASEALSTALLATSAAGNDSSKAALLTAANNTSTAATTAANDASTSTTANTKLIAASRKAQKLTGLSMDVGKVSFNINTGSLAFNGRPLTDIDQSNIALECQKIFKHGN